MQVWSNDLIINESPFYLCYIWPCPKYTNYNRASIFNIFHKISHRVPNTNHFDTKYGSFLLSVANDSPVFISRLHFIKKCLAPFIISELSIYTMDGFRIVGVPNSFVFLHRHICRPSKFSHFAILCPTRPDFQLQRWLKDVQCAIASI